MIIKGSPSELMYKAQAERQECGVAVQIADRITRGDSVKQRVYDYQAAWLYVLAEKYAREKGTLLEIGCYYGFTASIMAQAAPLANIITLGVHAWECDSARVALKQFGNVQVVCKPSWDFLGGYIGDALDMIFVDGDHKRIRKDLPWWNHLRTGGMMLFHDYSPAGSARACPAAYEGIRDFVQFLGREPDFELVDLDGAGMAGFVKLSTDREFMP